MDKEIIDDDEFADNDVVDADLDSSKNTQNIRIEWLDIKPGLKVEIPTWASSSFMIVKLLAKSRKTVNLEVATNGFDPKKTLLKLRVI